MNEEELKIQLQAAQETAAALRKRLVAVEGREKRLPFQQQLRAYQNRIEEEQHKLKLSQDWARLLVENSMDAIVGLDDKGLINHWNPRAQSMFGWTADEVMGKSIADILIPEILHDGELLETNCYFKGESADRKLEGHLIEVTGYHKDSSSIPLELLVLALKNQGQHQYVAILRDISERKKTEQILRDSHENLEQLVEERTQEVLASNALLTEAQKAGNIGTFTFDINTGCWTSSDMLNSILGIHEEYHRNIKGWLDIIHPDYRLNAWRFLKKTAFIENKALKLEVVVRRPDDRAERWILGYGKVLADAAGKPETIIGTVQDITERKLFEEHFSQTQKMEAIGTLVGGVAHEFNNMLAGMTGRLYLAKLAMQDNHEALDHLGKIEGLSFRAAEMIQQLLTFSRKGQVTKKTFDLVPFIKETLKLHHLSIPESIQINTTFSRYGLSIDGDEVQMQQILVNLLNNARDALEGVSNPRIDIRLELYVDSENTAATAQMKDGLFAHLSVSDNGCGMSVVTQSHIFEPFFTTKEVGKGTGLGLAMLYGAAETHQAHIEVESELGQGTTFNLYFPLSKAANHKVAEQSKLPLAGNGEIILLVDDETELRATGAEVLTRMGYHVLQAKDGLEALEVFTANEEDVALVIMDVVMPNMGGLGAANEIWKRKKGAKIIFCTGYDQEEVIDGADIQGSAFISKPYRVDELAQLIRNTIH